jgi:hypothetical protein
MGHVALLLREVADTPYQGIDETSFTRLSNQPRPLELIRSDKDCAVHADAPNALPEPASKRHPSDPAAAPDPASKRDTSIPAAAPASVNASEPDPDLVEDLAEQIATLAAHIHAVTYRFLSLIAEFDRLRGWELAGYSNCARWLHVRTGIDLGAAREKVRAARALEKLPLTSAAMARGELSFSQVRAVSRIATPENEGELLEFACGATTSQLERMLRAWRKGSRKDEARWEEERHRSRTFSVFPDDDGMYLVRGRLTPEVGALLMRAVEAASDALFRKPEVPGATDDSEAEAARRRGDAVGLLAERALAAGFGGDCPTAEFPISGTRAERYQVVLHVEPKTLAAEGKPGRSELEDGTRVSAETSRRLSCDASVVQVTETKEGTILDVGRKTRTISPALRRALEVRDRG